MICDLDYFYVHTTHYIEMFYEVELENRGCGKKRQNVRTEDTETCNKILLADLLSNLHIPSPFVLFLYVCLRHSPVPTLARCTVTDIDIPCVLHCTDE